MDVGPDTEVGAKPQADRTECLVRELIADLAEIKARRSLELEISLGRRIIDTLFHGKVELWQRRGRGDAKYRALAQHPKLPVTAAELYRVLSTYVLSVRLPAISTSKNLAPSHVHAVLPLNVGEQERVLRVAEAESWSVRELQQVVRTLHVPRKGPGRPRKARVLRTLQLLANLGGDAFDDTDFLFALQLDQIEIFRSRSAAILDELTHVQRILVRRALQPLPAMHVLLVSPSGDQTRRLIRELERADICVRHKRRPENITDPTGCAFTAGVFALSPEEPNAVATAREMLERSKVRHVIFGVHDAALTATTTALHAGAMGPVVDLSCGAQPLLLALKSVCNAPSAAPAP